MSVNLRLLCLPSLNIDFRFVLYLMRATCFSMYMSLCDACPDSSNLTEAIFVYIIDFLMFNHLHSVAVTIHSAYNDQRLLANSMQYHTYNLMMIQKKFFKF